MLNLRKDYFNHSILPIFGGLGVGTGNEKSCKDASMQHAITRIDTSQNKVKTRQCNMQ